MCMCMCTHMATKTISIMDDAYELLVRHRIKNESFSEVIRRNFSNKSDIMKFAGAWSHLSDEEIKKMKGKIFEMRKHSTKELLERIKK